MQAIDRWQLAAPELYDRDEGKDGIRGSQTVAKGRPISRKPFRLSCLNYSALKQRWNRR